MNKDWIFGEFVVQYKVKNRMPVRELPQIHSSRDAYEQFKVFYGEDHWNQEIFAAMYMNRSNRVYAIKEISRGSLTRTVVDVAGIFKHAILLGCSAIILCHNHPSETTKPSEQDLRIAKQVKAAGVLMEITVLDAMIYCDESYMSFADEGLF